MDAIAKQHRVPRWIWACISVVVHALLAALMLGPRPGRAADEIAPPMTMVPVAVEPPPEPPVAPEPEVRPAPVRSPRAERTPAPKRAAKAATAAEASGPPAETAPSLAPGEGTFPRGSDEGSGNGTGAGSVGSGAPPPEPERKPGPAQFSLWMDVDAFTQMALVRPGISVLMAVPGFRDMMRGSGLRPFTDFRLVRVGLQGLAAERLVLAGVHGGGEQALLDTAERIAAMRSRRPIVRGDADLRASAWEDGSGVDRGLAVHGSAFVIGARTALPRLLGTHEAAQRVVRLSSLREHVALQLNVEDASRYLPGLQACGLEALRASVAVNGDRPRLALSAYYRAASLAHGARACLLGLEAGGGRLSGLVKWLASAESAPGLNSTRLKVEVTSADIEQLLEELAWALRSA